jgi:hypothetical protein
MSLGTWLLVAVVIAVLFLVTDLGQLWWFGRRSNPDHGPLRRDDWEPTTAGDLHPGDVVLSSHLSPNPETVVGIDAAVDTEAGVDERVVLRFRSGRSRTVDPAMKVKRHRPPAA